MKKALLLAVCLLLCSATLFAQVIGVVNVKPYFTFDNSPAALPSSAGKLDWDLSSSWWETRQDYWHKLYANPSFLDLGMEVKTKNVNMVFILDIR